MCGSGANATRQNGSTPGLSGNSHPHRLVEERREKYVLPCPALPQSLSVGQVKILRELKNCTNFFSFLVTLPADIHDIFSSVSLIVSINSAYTEQLKNNTHLL